MTREEEYELLMKWEKMDDASAYSDFQKEKSKALYKWVKEGNSYLDFEFMGEKLVPQEKSQKEASGTLLPKTD